MMATVGDAPPVHVTRTPVTPAAAALSGVRNARGLAIALESVSVVSVPAPAPVPVVSATLNAVSPPVTVVDAPAPAPAPSASLGAVPVDGSTSPPTSIHFAAVGS